MKENNMSNNINELQVQVIANIIDESTGNIIIKLNNCDFPIAGDKLMLRTNEYISEFLITKRSLVIDSVEQMMCWNIYCHTIGTPIVTNMFGNINIKTNNKSKNKNNNNESLN